MKKYIKTAGFAALLTSGILMLALWTSCNNDKCKAVVCAYNGVCNDGVCTCPTGYEGPQCEKITREKFEGVYNVLERGTLSQTANYSVSVEQAGEVNELSIGNFKNIFVDRVKADVRGDSLFIRNQTVDNRWVVEGYGVFESEGYYGMNGRMVLYYNVRDLSLPEGNPADEFGLNAGSPSVWTK